MGIQGRLESKPDMFAIMDNVSSSYTSETLVAKYLWSERDSKESNPLERVSMEFKIFCSESSSLRCLGHDLSFWSSAEEAEFQWEDGKRERSLLCDLWRLEDIFGQVNLQWWVWSTRKKATKASWDYEVLASLWIEPGPFFFNRGYPSMFFRLQVDWSTKREIPTICYLIYFERSLWNITGYFHDGRTIFLQLPELTSFSFHSGAASQAKGPARARLHTYRNGIYSYFK